MAYIEWLRSHVGQRQIIVAYATAIVRDARGQILFQRRSDFEWWGLPGGVLEIGESLAECACRETWEETGFNVEPLRLVGVYTGPQYFVHYPNGDEVQQWTATIECRVIGGQPRADGGEGTEVAFFPPEALPPHPPWYADMVRDTLTERATATFERPRPQAPDKAPSSSLQVRVPADVLNREDAVEAHLETSSAGHGDYLGLLRSLVGPARLIAPSASAFIQDEVGRILLMQRTDNGVWHPPGGFMELGESVAETVVREMREETGLIVEPVRLIGVYSGPDNQWTYLNGDAIQGCATFFECRVTGGQLRIQASEVAALDYFPPDALPESLTPRWRPRLIQAAANLPQAVFR